MHELVRVDVGQRRDSERRVADQLGEHAAGAERDERAEDRILDDAGEQLDVRLSRIGCTSTGSADPRGRIADGCLVDEASATPPVSVLCAPASAVLSTTGKPSSAAAATASSCASRRAARRTTGMP